jgi:hypothetical protein
LYAFGKFPHPSFSLSQCTEAKRWPKREICRRRHKKVAIQVSTSSTTAQLAFL